MSLTDLKSRHWCYRKLSFSIHQCQIEPQGQFWVSPPRSVGLQRVGRNWATELELRKGELYYFARQRATQLTPPLKNRVSWPRRVWWVLWFKDGFADKIRVYVGCQVVGLLIWVCVSCPFNLFFNKTFYFVLGYSRLTMWSFQANSEGTQPHSYMYPFSLVTPLPPSWHMALSRVPCAIR